MNTFFAGKLKVHIYQDREEMGRAAAADTAEVIRLLLEKRDSVNAIFAAAPSQNELLRHLTSYTGIDWSKVNAFHMDEYVGLSADAPQLFSTFLTERLFAKLPFKSVNLLNACAPDPQEECDRYAALLEKYPPDVVCMGIGENGHIAFNDPPVADFQDSTLVKIVELDDICRKQQVNDGCFAHLREVPTHAMTLTIPALTRAPVICCVVPAATKAEAVYRTLNDEIGTLCPATVLRRHEDATLYLEPDSAKLILRP